MARYKTGEECPKTGRYRFDGSTDGKFTPKPTEDEMEIKLSKGEVSRRDLGVEGRDLGGAGVD